MAHPHPLGVGLARAWFFPRMAHPHPLVVALAPA